MTTDRFLTVEGRPTVRLVRSYPHPVELVWRAVTTPEHLSAWFPSPVELDLRPGGAIRFPAFAGDAAEHGVVEELHPPTRLVFTWGDDRLCFELEAHEEGTRFELTHSFDDRAGAPSFAAGWDQCLAGLRSLLADQPLPPADRNVERHEQLVREFGLDRPEVVETEGRWTVRVERQLTCPEDVARRLWDEVATSPDVAIELSFAEGTGHGARIVVTATGDDPAQRDAAVDWTGSAVAEVAERAATWNDAPPAER